MQLVGHNTESIYRRYAIVAKQDLDYGQVSPITGLFFAKIPSAMKAFTLASPAGRLLNHD